MTEIAKERLYLPLFCFLVIINSQCSHVLKPFNWALGPFLYNTLAKCISLYYT